ncbi:Bin3-domain-containing protein [Marasmius fiardii PR-910]|nr:Bin3-domain-containing protein [Marasmius fiardii PR-910]
MTTQHIPIHGNYHGYYTRRPFVNDPRLALLPDDFFAGKHVLDIGCNEGWVTIEIAQKWDAEKVVGVDIDDTLIRAAWRRRLAVWSQQGPNEVEGTQESNKKKQKRKRKSSPSPEALRNHCLKSDYFPSSLEHMFGPLPVPPSENRGKNVFPHNVSFRVGDWAKDSDAVPEDQEGYDIVLAFSISKWIHLNEGDEGLKAFFRRVYDVLRPGGVFILEPQAWDSYKRARRIMHNADIHRESELNIRPDDFPSILRKLGFGPVKHIGTTGEEGFFRPVDMYLRV